MLGNKAANVRAGVPRDKADEAAGGLRHVLHLPMPRVASGSTEVVARTPSPHVAALDYFVFGRATKEDKYEGFLMVMQPWTTFVQLRRITKRSSKSFTRAFADMARVFSQRFGRVDLLLGDEDTAFEKNFQAYLDRQNIRRFHDRSPNKIAQVERTGALVKRMIAAASKRDGRAWHAVLKQCQDKFNATYVNRLGLGPPDKYTEENFGEVVEAVYDKDPIAMHALYSMGHHLGEGEDADALFKYKLGQKVLVSLRRISKVLRNPVRNALIK